MASFYSIDDLPALQGEIVGKRVLVAALTRKGDLVSVAGGGETVAALAAVQVIADFSYVSTAGGAFLEWLEGKKLPGVEALKKPRGST